MKVIAVESNNQRRGRLFPMVEGAVIGSAAGYLLKGNYPVTPQEKATPAYQRVMAEIDAKRNLYGPENEAWLDEIRAKGKKMSLAEDTFVKMYDGKKEGDKLGHGFNKKIRENYLALHSQDNAAAQEFRRLMHQARYAVDQTVSRSIEGYNSATKAIRPTSFFVISGAVVGALITLVNNMLKTEVKS